jgi:undecaprenyl-diphosphatase
MPRALHPRLLGLAGLCALAALVLAATDLDLPLFLAINHAAAHALPHALPSCLTLLGNGLAAVALLGPFIERAPAVLFAGLCAAPVGGLLSRTGKLLVGRPRPAAVLDPAQFDFQGPLLGGHNAFPSGHSITIFLVAAVLIAGLEPGRARPWAVCAVLTLASLVALSRVMVGAHWPSDTLGGAALGTLAGVAGCWCARSRPLVALAHWRHARALLAAIVLSCSLVLARIDTGYPLALPLQLALAAMGAVFAVLALARRPLPAPSRPAP